MIGTVQVCAYSCRCTGSSHSQAAAQQALTACRRMIAMQWCRQQSCKPLDEVDININLTVADGGWHVAYGEHCAISFSHMGLCVL